MNRKTPLRIAFFPEYFYPHVGGAETWTANIARCLARLGHNVEVFTYRMPGATSDQTVSGVEIRRIGRPFVIAGSRPYFKRFLIHLTASFLTLMNSNRFDVVIAQYTPLLPLKLASSIRGIPIVAIFHDVYGLDASIQQKGILGGLIRYVFGDLLITRFRYDGIVAVSDATERKLRRFRCKTTQIEVVRNAVDADLIDSIAGRKIPKQICFVGRLLKHKHVDDLLLSFARVLKSEPNAKLIVIGDGDEKGRLVSLTRELGIGGSVNFTGFVEDREKIRLMKSSELLVLPSTDEGWGNVITEAIACGLNTISCDIPALREQARFFHSIVLVPPHDIDALARAIEHSLSKGDHDSVLADSARVRSDFTWMRRAEELEQFMYQVIKGRD